MKVGELIRKLQEYDADMEVFLEYDSSFEYVELEDPTVSIQSVFDWKNKYPCYGCYCVSNSDEDMSNFRNALILSWR
jgi:hypothetical protein